MDAGTKSILIFLLFFFIAFFVEIEGWLSKVVRFK
jgi:hypothetical protein